MKNVFAKCYVNGVAYVTVVVPDDATEEDIFSEVEYNLDMGSLDPDLTDIDIQIEQDEN